MNRLSFSIVLATGLGLLPALAQEPSPPKDLLPLKTPASYAWERVAYPLPAGTPGEKDFTPTSKPLAQGGKVPNAAPESAARRPLKVSGTHADKNTREVLLWSDGKTTESWIVGGFVLQQNPEDGSVAVIDPRVHSEMTGQLSASPFAELLWLRPAFYRGTQMIKGRTYYCYRVGNSAPVMDSSDSQLSPSLAVWIDSETRLPYASTDDNSLWLYRETAFDSKPLTLPAEFRAALELNEKCYYHQIGRFKPLER